MFKQYTIKIAMFAAIVILLVRFESPAPAMPVSQAGAAVLPPLTDPPALNKISVDTADRVKCLYTLKGHRDRVLALAISGDGAYLASSSRDKTIKLWDVNTRQEVHSFNGKSARMNGIAFSPNGRLLASGEAIWDVESKKRIHVLEGGLVARVDYSPDGSLLAVALLDDRDIFQPTRLWDVASGKLVHEFDNQGDNVTHSIAFSPDGELLAVANPFGTVALWNVKSGQITTTFDCGNKNAGMHDVIFSPKGDVLAAAGTDYKVRLWDMASGKETQTLKHGSGVNSVAFSPDGTILVSVGKEHVIRLWNVKTGSVLRALPHDDELMAAVFSPDSTLLVTGGYDNHIHIWGVSR